MNTATKILLFVGAVIITCVLCVMGFKMTNENKSAANGYINNFNNMTSQYQDIDKSIYEGSSVKGSEIIRLIKDVIKTGNPLAIRVNTKAGSVKDYNYNFTPETATKAASLGTQITTKVDAQLTTDTTSPSYINTEASFTGKVYKDANDMIICIEFTQM